jgi:hypothetical protein
MRRSTAALLVAALSAPATVASASEADGLVVNTTSGTIDCGGRDVDVIASDARLVFTGACGELHFTGDRTTATIESATLLQVAGKATNLRVRSPLADALLAGNGGTFHFESVDDLRVNGDDLRVEAGRIGAVTLAGSRNEVQWSAGSPSVHDLGNRNVLRPRP